MTEYIAVNSNNLITSFVWGGLLDRAKCGELLETIKMCSVEAVPIEELQEIRQEINKINCGDKQEPFSRIAPKGFYITGDGVKEIVLEIIDNHISALNNDQFEGIWQNTVEEMKRRKICEDILEEAEKWDSETMSGSLLTDDDLRQLIGDGISRCKEREKEQDKVTQWIKDNADFIREMARMLEDGRIQG